MDDSQPYPAVFDDVSDLGPAPAMPDAVRFLDDYYLAQECLAGRASALAHLQETYREPLLAYLQGAGARPHEADEIVTELWSDCVASQTGSLPKLARYNGASALKTFLHTITLNVFVSRRRREKHAAEPLPDEPAEGTDANQASGPADTSAAIEEPLLKLMREAIQRAFMACPAEDYVLLQLAHTDDLHVMELAKMFDRSKSALSRDVQRAGQEIARNTMQNIKASDPWLELKWEDFLDLCRTAGPACFGGDAE